MSHHMKKKEDVLEQVKITAAKLKKNLSGDCRDQIDKSLQSLKLQ